MAQMLHTLQRLYTTLFDKIRTIDFLAPSLIRLYLAPIFIIAGYTKLQLGAEGVGFFERFTADPKIVGWFGNPDWGLGMPLPGFMAFLTAWTEFLGGWLLLLGFLVRFISIPLAFTMLVAAATVHWDNGWFAIAPSNSETSAARVLSWVGIPGAEASLENSGEVAARLDSMRSILGEHGNTDWLFEKGSIVVLNNGIEFAATYFILCLVLVFWGGGRYTSLDYWLRRSLG